jgi:hypothetical protein
MQLKTRQNRVLLKTALEGISRLKLVFQLLKP